MKESNKTFISVNQALSQLQSKIKDVPPYIIKTGWSALDEYINGFGAGELCVIGGRPAMGKSVLVSRLISSMVCKGIPVGYITTTDILNVNFMSRIVGDITNAVFPYTYENRLHFIEDATLAEVPLYFDYEQKMTILSLREKAFRLKEEKNIKCLFVESIQTLFELEDNSNVKLNADRISRELKILAQELNIPIIITSELNKAPEYRGLERKPQLCDLRSCKSLECYADKVLLLNRPEYYGCYVDERGRTYRGIIIVTVAKNKYGSTGEFRYVYKPAEMYKWADDPSSTIDGPF